MFYLVLILFIQMLFFCLFLFFFFLMIRRPPRSTRTDTLFPYTTLFRSRGHCGSWLSRGLPLPLSGILDISPSPASGRGASLVTSCRACLDQPFSCEAGEGGAQRRMRARAQRACFWVLGKDQRQLAALAPLIRPAGTFSRKRTKGCCCHVLSRCLPGQPNHPASGFRPQLLILRPPCRARGFRPP